MYHGKIKASEKLPRGTYFYLKVGGRFYAGEEVVTKETRTTERDRYSGYSGWDWWGNTHKWSQGTAKYLNARGWRIPRYHIEADKPAPKDPKVAVIGHKPRFTDDFKQAKQFRRRNQAEAACERITAMYADFDIRVSIELHEGER